MTAPVNKFSKRHREAAKARKRRNKQLSRDRRRGVEPDVPVAVGMDRQTTLMIQTFGQ